MIIKRITLLALVLIPTLMLGQCISGDCKNGEGIMEDGRGGMRGSLECI